LVLAQSCGAFNDNLVKNAMVVLAIFQLHIGGAGLSALAGALFIAPYALLSATAGKLADRFEKPRLIRLYKAMEVALMVLAALAFLSGNVPALLAVLVGLGVQAALFGPVKYGVLPELLAEDELIAGNGMIEATTFLCIVAGTVAGGGLILLGGGTAIVGVVGMALSLLGLFGAMRMPEAAAADPSLRIRWNLLAETSQLLRLARGQSDVWLCILGLSWFWTVGATLMTEFPVIARDTLRGDGSVMTLLLSVFAIGVGAGSILCAKLLHGEVSPRFVPFAALGISLFCWDFARATEAAGGLANAAAVAGSLQGWRAGLDLFLLAACGGVFSVPLYAIIQDAAKPAERSRMVAANNVMNALFMVLGAAAAALLSGLGSSAPLVLIITAAANFLVAIWIFRILPHGVQHALLRGFSFLGRAKRVARIGGETVSLAAAEAAVCSFWPENQHAVVPVPDALRGQRLILATTLHGADLNALLVHARQHGIPEIMVPRAVLPLASMPVLPTGKVDYPVVERLAREAEQPVAA
jgi:MFS family permease